MSGRCLLPTGFDDFRFYVNYKLNGIKVRVFFGRNIETKHLRHHDKSCCYFCKSNIPIVNLIAGSRNMIKLSKMMSL